MTDLSELTAELRRAAKTTEKIADIFVRIAGEKNQREVFELKWVPAGLAAKEMQKINEAHNHDLWASMEWGFIVGEKGQMNIQRARIEFAKTIKK